MTAVRLVYYLAPASEIPSAIDPLLRLLYGSKEAERVVLGNLLVIAEQHPVRSSFLLLNKLSHPYLSQLCPLNTHDF